MRRKSFKPVLESFDPNIKDKEFQPLESNDANDSWCMRWCSHQRIALVIFTYLKTSIVPFL